MWHPRRLLFAALLVAPAAAHGQGPPCSLDFVAPVPRHMIPEDPNDQFGAAVATHGDRLAVGIPWFDGKGAVATFHRVPLGWALTTFLQSPAPADNDRFGNALDMHGDLLVVGAPGSDLAGAEAGAVFVYRFDVGSGDWLAEDILHSPNGANAQAGMAVSARGDAVAMGTGNNRAHVFRLTGGSWQHEQELLPPDPAHNLSFGDAVAIHGDRLLVADDRHSDTALVSKAGRVYSYLFASGSWSLAATLAPPTPTQAALHFGEELDLFHDWAVISAHLDDPATPQPGGLVYAYEFAADATVLQHQLLAPVPGASGDAFGRGVAIHERRIVVGAPGENGNEGGAYQFDHVNGTWQLTHHEPLPPGYFSSQAYFGQSVAVHDWWVVGAHRPSQLDDTGRVFIANPCAP